MTTSYRKKPVEVQAVQSGAVFDDRDNMPSWLKAERECRRLRFVDALGGIVVVDGEEARRLDWIVRDATGAISVVPASVFAATYEPVKDGSFDGGAVVDAAQELLTAYAHGDNLDEAFHKLAALTRPLH